MTTRIALLYIEGCPSHPPTRERLLDVAGELGVEAEIEEIAVGDEAQGARLGFLGSPTVLVEGRDLEADLTGDGEVDTATTVGLSCRVYRAPDGTRTGVPPRELVERALRE